MRILVTGYSRQHTSSEYTGTFASMLTASLRLAGHYVVHGEPLSVMEDDFDYFLIGVDSPLAVTSRTSLSCLAMIAELADSEKLKLFVDDPNIRKLGSSHTSALEDPKRLLTPYLERNRTQEDVKIFQDRKTRNRMLVGADLIANVSEYDIECLYPLHAWAPRASNLQFPGGVSDSVGVDMSWLLLRPDAVLDMGVEAHELGAIARNRAEIWITQEKTTSRAKNTWISEVKANLIQPYLPAVNSRYSLIEGFCQALLSMGVLEQPPSASVSGWWTPWLALAVASGGYYSTKGIQDLSPAFGVLPAQFEGMTSLNRSRVIEQQRDTVRSLISEWSSERVADLILAKESIRG